MKRPIETYTDSFGQTIEFIVPEPHKKICINISGGADSAILLWMLVQYCEKYIPDAEIYAITSANSFKKWKNATFSNRVMDRVFQLTNTTLIKVHYTFFSDDQRRSELSESEQLMKKQNGITFTIHGTNQNPSMENRKDFGLESYAPRDPGHGRSIISNHNDIITWNPFINVDKRMVAYLYTHFDLIESLFSHTRSCEWHENTFFSPDPGDGHCGECWWCKEREWAFGRL